MLTISFLTFLGYIAAIAIGLSLGLVGSGGSILTVPVLVYLVHIKPEIATTYSLFVVGTSSFVGSLQYTRQKLVDYRTALMFGLPSVTIIYITKLLLVPLIPSHLFSLGSFEVTKDVFIMVVFAILMVGTSVSMIHRSNKPDVTESGKPQHNRLQIILKGAMVGFLTGLFGVGGGFLIIPALMFLVKLPIRVAVGTSLVIIAFNCLIGFLGAITIHNIEWNILFLYTTFAVAGIFIGERLARRFSSQQLRPLFGWFVLAMGVYIIVRELLINN